MAAVPRSKSMSSFRNGSWITKKPTPGALSEGLERGFFKESVDEVGPRGETPLLSNTRIGHVEAVEWLLTKGGAALDARDERGYPCTHIAAEVGGLHTLRKQGGTALWVAAAEGHFEVVEYLHQLHGDKALLEVTRNGESPLWAAASKGRSRMVEYIHGYGRFESLVRATTGGQTPLQVAAEKGHLDTVNVIVRLGGQPVLDNDSQAEMTAIDYASKNGQRAVIQFLSGQGATRRRSSSFKRSTKPASTACAIL